MCDCFGEAHIRLREVIARIDHKIMRDILSSTSGMIPEFYYADFPRQFRLRKRERSSSYVTDDEDENGRKGHVRKERNYSKTASYSSVGIAYLCRLVMMK